MLIKKRDKIESQHLLLPSAVIKHYIYGEHNLIEDFNIIKKRIFDAYETFFPKKNGDTFPF